MSITVPMRIKILILLVSIGCIIIYINSKEADRLPKNEMEFIQLNEYTKDQWKNAPNEIQQERMRSDRDQSLCQHTRTVTNWIGTVDSVGSYWSLDDAPPASFGVKLNQNITLRTEGSTQDSGTKIIRGTALYNSIGRLTKGQKVIFSGEFLPGAKTCFDETSFTDNGSIMDPNYIFKFTEVSASQ